MQLPSPSRPLKWQRAGLILFFSALLLASGFAKLLDSRGYARILGDWDLFPAAALPAISTTLGLAEFTAGLGLLTGGRRRRVGATAVAVLMALYVLLDLTALLRGLHIANTGTFGIYLPSRLTGARAVQDAFLLCLAVALRQFQNRRSSDRRHQDTPVRWAMRH